MEETRVAIREDKAVALYELETRFAMAVRQRELLENYIRERLKPEKHFYTVDDDPGRKPSLTKEGAELICLPHALKGHYEWLSGPENPPLDDTPYQITMKCELEANGKFAGEGVGSASSHITTREIKDKPSEHKPRQKDPGLRHNTTIKMACKSAYIAATLNSTAASEFFTQDLEDDQTGETSKSQPKGHWCKLHGVVFFMKGKMKSYAHPIKDEKGNDTGEWCHEHKDTPKEVKPEPEPVADLEPEKEPETEKPQEPAPKPASNIDMEWLKESLAELKTKAPKTWSDANVIAYMKKSYGLEGADPMEIASKLDQSKAKHFIAKVQEALQMV